MEVWRCSPSRFTGCLFDTGHGGRCLWLQMFFLSVHKSSIVCVVVIEKPHKKTEMYSSVDTKVNGRKSLPYKIAGELFSPLNLHLLTLIGKRTYIYSLLLENKQWEWIDVGLAQKLFLTPNLHLFTLIGKQAIRVSKCRFGGINNSPAKFISTRFYSDFHANQ